jgi:hypothetical protein
VGRRREAYVSYDGKRSKGQALLETDHLLFRGEFRLKIPLTEIGGMKVSNDALRVEFGGRVAAFELGSGVAEAWLAKIRNPPSLLDKLGVKPDDSVCVIGVDDLAFRAELAARLTSAPRTRLGKNLALVFYGANSMRELGRLATLRESLRPDGAIWVISRKGKAATLKDTEVMAAAKGVGLVDTKVASFSSTHTALKLVIPRAMRAARKAPR